MQIIKDPKHLGSHIGSYLQNYVASGLKKRGQKGLVSKKVKSSFEEFFTFDMLEDVSTTELSDCNSVLLNFIEDIRFSHIAHIAPRPWGQSLYESTITIYRKVASTRPVYYSILEFFGQRSQNISIKVPLHKQSENPQMCY